MIGKVLKAIKEHNLIEANDNILIGVSGGADSMTLLHLLVELKQDLNFNIYVAHINHGVRGEASDSDEEFVKNVAEKLDLPHYSIRVDMNAYAKDNKITSEEAGRELRYSFFRDILSSVGGGKIAVAHNRNDQAETLLMRFIRGTGIDGLKGMEFKNKDVIRPILGISRTEIENYIVKNNIEFVQDLTNFQSIYNRNKVRLELLPYIEENFNPNIVNTLWRTSKISSLDSDFLEEFSSNKFVEILKSNNKSSIILDGKILIKEHLSVQQRVIRKAILEINQSLQGITESHITSIVQMLSNENTGKQLNISNNIIAKINYCDLIIEKGIKEIQPKYKYDLNINCTNHLNEIEYEIDIKVIKNEKIYMDFNNPYIKYFDFDIINGSLSIRNRENGDKITPFGMRGTKKLKDYFIDEKIPRDQRDSIPLIVDKENIIWVIGYRINDLYKVTKKTKNILVITAKKYNKEDLHGEHNKRSVNQ